MQKNYDGLEGRRITDAGTRNLSPIDKMMLAEKN
jgi:hypothetical protein